MSLFAIVGFDAPDAKAKRIEHMDAHCKALLELKRAGRLFCAGPLFHSTDEDPDYAGSIFIIDVDNLQEATEWFDTEPYTVAGVYQDINIKPYFDAMDYIEKYS